MKQLRYSTQQITEGDIKAVSDVLRSDWLTCGPKVREFEDALAEYVGAKYAVAVNSGTAALCIAYSAVDRYRILTSPLTFIATANAALISGRDVFFQDIAENGNVKLEGYRNCISVPVHFAGRAAPIPDGPKGSVVIEDACHALGAMEYNGTARVGACTRSLACCFSFHPVKPITTGEGGAVTTNDQGLADEIRSLRSHGRKDGLMVSLGGNYRMPDINAALGLSQLKRCDAMRERRAGLALYYHRIRPEGIDFPMLRSMCAGVEHDGICHPAGPMTSMLSWHLLPVRIGGGRRDEVKAKLQAQGIGVQVHYDPPVHLHPYYRERYSYKLGDFPNAEAWAAEELSLPLHAGMTEADVDRVVGALTEALR